MTVKLDPKKGPAMICEGGPRDGFALYDKDWEAHLACEAYDGRTVPYRKTDRQAELPGSRHKEFLTVWEYVSE